MEHHNQSTGNLLSADGLLQHSYRPLSNSTDRWNRGTNGMGHHLQERFEDQQMRSSADRDRLSEGHNCGGSLTPALTTNARSVGSSTPLSVIPIDVGRPLIPPSSTNSSDHVNPFLASAATRKISSSTRKQNRTRAEIDTDKALTAANKAEKAQKAAQKLEAQRQKRSAKEARAALKGSVATPPTPRFVWSEEASLELLRFVKEAKDEHDDLSKRTAGFIAWTPYFLNRQADRGDYPLLNGIANDVILRRYQALMNLWKVGQL
ncbi:hypothetical protein PGT21_006802 [Puccinia graminis f. sp. tritici]|uniref:Uncharacterized protein n=1 Tax=Puccinia graminis f. sp. tritici TaxID=56615 RepID=A0A5B0SGE3_PUCGR|nr:hypothetical protein PGT21_006802 [Puccinia graminis f. sp. tritici]KAA1135534.1 hypothetical protein PGTUg99_014651 [Puccinia graminis f. sp. tritici]